MLKFPKEFIWGAATAATQIEGAATLDGKGLSIWDTFAASKVCKNQATPKITCDSYHHIDRDIEALKYINAKSYRFSIAWTRIIPDGDGEINQLGFKYYDELIDKLLANNIEPYITLFHWDLPENLSQKGDWLSRNTSYAFERYTKIVIEHFGNKVKNYMTFNEIPTFSRNGYQLGLFAPGKQLNNDEMKIIHHHVLLAHGLAVKTIREYDKNIKIGLAHDPFSKIPLTQNAECIEATRKSFANANGRLLDAIFHGFYPKNEKIFKENLPADLDIISQKLDFLGLNIYSGNYVEADENGNFKDLDFPKNHPRGNNLEWLYWCPDGLYYSAKFIHENYFSGDLYITENGYSSSDCSKEDFLNDLDRVTYFRNCLSALSNAIRDGIPYKGYFFWSLMDNFEWREGFTQRFGIFYTDYENFKLYPKKSCEFYRSITK